MTGEYRRVGDADIPRSHEAASVEWLSLLRAVRCRRDPAHKAGVLIEVIEPSILAREILVPACMFSIEESRPWGPGLPQGEFVQRGWRGELSSGDRRDRN